MIQEELGFGAWVGTFPVALPKGEVAALHGWSLGAWGCLHSIPVRGHGQDFLLCPGVLSPRRSTRARCFCSSLCRPHKLEKVRPCLSLLVRDVSMSGA